MLVVFGVGSAAFFRDWLLTRTCTRFTPLPRGTATDYVFLQQRAPIAFTWEIYGDQKAHYMDCFRMFNPTEKSGHAKVVQDWVGAAVSLLPMLRTHPELPMAAALEAAATAAAGGGGAGVGVGVGGGSVAATVMRQIHKQGAALRGGGGVETEVAAARSTVRGKVAENASTLSSADASPGDGNTGAGGSTSAGTSTETTGTSGSGGGGGVPTMDPSVRVVSGLGGSAGLGTGGGGGGGNPWVLAAEVFACVGVALFVYCCVVPRYQRARFIQKVKHGVRVKSHHTKKLSV